MRKILVSAFVIFHFSAVTLWVFWPYAEQFSKDSSQKTPFAALERGVLEKIRSLDDAPVFRLVDFYINTLGLHQYWDFFAPQTPRVHRYLRVCRHISLDPESKLIACKQPLYKSYRGTLGDAVHSFDGLNSRDFRFTENMVRLHRLNFYEKFLKYWHDHAHTGSETKRSEIYAIISEFELQPDSRPNSAGSIRRDEVVWMITP